MYFVICDLPVWWWCFIASMVSNVWLRSLCWRYSISRYCLTYVHMVLSHLGIKNKQLEVVKFYCYCHTSQITEKLNTVIPFAPLHDIPVIHEPFEHILYFHEDMGRSRETLKGFTQNPDSITFVLSRRSAIRCCHCSHLPIVKLEVLGV